jgi:hypothetical protein
MSFIDLQFVRIQSEDIMTDSVQAKQMLLTINSCVWASLVGANGSSLC